MSLDNFRVSIVLDTVPFGLKRAVQVALSPWFSATVFGVMTAVFSLVGLQLGRAAARLIRIRSDLLSGSP